MLFNQFYEQLFNCIFLFLCVVTEEVSQMYVSLQDNLIVKKDIGNWGTTSLYKGFPSKYLKMKYNDNDNWKLIFY